uniref:Nucleotide-diphospho-sugar transferase domain-containing protein n=1 Tax=viral metagenome TaxID=1070528 RepID=A0A6C0KK38_9ZZZZ
MITECKEDVIHENNRFDIVIPVGPNDTSIITTQIEYTKKNIIGYRNIYIICCNDSLTIDGCITISENIFPFSLQTIAEYHGKVERNGWYLQQLLKLYAGFVIPDILDKYLVIDSDTFFLKQTRFIDNGKCLYAYGVEYHPTYFAHMQKLHPRLTKKYTNISGICHHMIFEKRYLKELFEIVENVHKDIFYKIFLKNVTDIRGSGASEYEIYFNYMCHKHPDKIVIRPLQWKNTNTMEIYGNFDYVSYHWYMR